MHAAGSINCTVSLQNTGSVRLTHVQVVGPENNCSAIAVLQPGQNVSAGCVVRLSVNQTHFDAREADGSAATTLGMAVQAVAQSILTGASIAPASDTVSGLELPIVRSFSVNASLDKASVNVTGAGVSIQAAGKRLCSACRVICDANFCITSAFPSMMCCHRFPSILQVRR